MMVSLFRALFIPFAFVAIVIVFLVMSSQRRRETRARYEAELRNWYAQYPNPQLGSAPPPAPPTPSAWSIAGTTVAVVAAVGGLAVLAMALMLFVSISSGNFKFGNK